METIISLGVMGAVFFGIQLSICFKAERIAKKLILSYILLFLLLFSLPLYLGVFGSCGGGGLFLITGNAILGILLAVGAGSALVGVVLAWGVLGLCKLLERKWRNND